MAINRRTMAVSALIASMWGEGEWPAEAQNQRLPMRVVVYDYTDAEPAILQQAQRALARIFGEIDVDVTWLDVAQFTREMPPDPAERLAFVATVHPGQCAPALQCIRPWAGKAPLWVEPD